MTLWTIYDEDFPYGYQAWLTDDEVEDFYHKGYKINYDDMTIKAEW